MGYFTLSSLDIEEGCTVNVIHDWPCSHGTRVVYGKNYLIGEEDDIDGSKKVA